MDNMEIRPQLWHPTPPLRGSCRQHLFQITPAHRRFKPTPVRHSLTYVIDVATGTAMSTVFHLTPRTTSPGWLTSLAFWLCLFVSAALYGSVTLSPKLLAYFTLNREYHANQWKLVSLEKQVARLQKVIDAQKNDPSFVREQARSDFDIASPDEQRIPVDSHLRLNIGSGAAEAP